MHASFVIRRVSSDRPPGAVGWVGTAPDWAMWEIDLVDIPELVTILADADAAIVACVYDSSVCEIVGLHARREHWRWTFGETAGADDPEGLEDSLPERAAEAADAIVSWASVVGLDGDRTRLIQVLGSGDAFAEAGLFDLLRHLGIADGDLDARDDYREPARDAPAVDESARQAWAQQWAIEMRPHVARLHSDRAPEAWTRFVDVNALHGFGVPAAVLRWAASTIVLATDPPVAASAHGGAAPTVHELIDNWALVPDAVAGSISEAAAWAREVVGPARRPATTDRRPLRGEVDDQPLDGQGDSEDLWRHRVAGLPSLHAVLTLSEEVSPAGADVAEWLTDVGTQLLARVTTAYEAQGRTVVHDEPVFVPSGSMGTGCVKLLRSGRLAVSSLVGPRWKRLLTDVTADRVTEVNASAKVDRWGFLTLKLRVERDEYAGGPRIELHVPEPFLQLGGSDAVVGSLRHAATNLPVTSGSIYYCRKLGHGPWVSLMPATPETAALGRDGLFNRAEPITNPVGDLTWLQATDEPFGFTSDSARKIADALDLEPVTF